MKRIGNLFARIVSMENLRLADEKARRGKRNTYGVKLHDKHREENLEKLHEALLTHTYKTSPYTIYTIHEPKERVIYRLPYYPDRIVHHAIMNVLEPIWVKTFTYNTYSCIKGRGIEGCSQRVTKIIKLFEGQPLYCLKLDVRKFYPSIKHHVLKRLIRRKIKDAELLSLLDEIIDSTEGLPIGNYLSQYLANLTLCYLMHWVDERLPQEIADTLRLEAKPKLKATEYADDIVLFASNKAVLHEALQRIKNKIEQELELRLKGNYQIFPIVRTRADHHGRALDYIGYKHFREQRLLRKSIKQSFCRAAAKIATRSEKEKLSILSSWLGWAKHSNSRHLLHSLNLQVI